MIEDNDEIKNLLKAFDDLGSHFEKKGNRVSSPSTKKINSKDLEKQLKDEAAKNSHKRLQKIWDFLTDAIINVIKAAAFIIPIILVFCAWAWCKHNNLADVANEIIVFSKRFFDMFIGFLLGNFLNSIFKKDN
ncbi:hypothetical protein IJ182_08850 [bacterium]|nr:hypothetical protein [bacterium]